MTAYTALGIDVSTQGVKALVLGDDNEIRNTAAINFGRDLKQYGAPNGFIQGGRDGEVHADPRMWVDGLHLALQALADSGADLKSVRVVAVSGQQHGSVYLRGSYQHGIPLSEQLSRPTAPIWMDSSTSAECALLTERFGDEIRSRTGSAPALRFTFPQIMAFARRDPAAYAATGRIHLVSSFITSVLSGQDAPIDYGDGAGMNLLNLRTMHWDDEIAALCPGTLDKLSPPVPSGTAVGMLCGEFSKYGFGSDVKVLAGTGDNNSSLVGMNATDPGIYVVSLGTSDTVFAPMREFRTDPTGRAHVFGNPLGGFMSLACFASGSLVREALKNELGVDWAFMDEGAFAGDSPAAKRVRELYASQVAALREGSRWMGEKPTVVRVTGGASRSAGLKKLIGEAFDAPVETIAVPDSAALGAAIRGMIFFRSKSA